MPPNEHEIVGKFEFRQDLTLAPDDPPQPKPGPLPWLAAVRFRVLRASDLAHFDVAAYGVALVRHRAGPPQLVPVTDNARLEVHLTFQHVGEQAFYEVTDPPAEVVGPNPGKKDEAPPVPSTTEPTEPHPIKALAAWPSRLVFRVPEGESIEFSTSGVLAAMGRLPLIVVPLATPLQQIGTLPPTAVRSVAGGVAKAASTSKASKLTKKAGDLGKALSTLQPRQPRPDETAIEAPFRLILSPSTRGGFRHELEPVAHPDNPAHIELWHTRLGVRHVADNGRVHVDEEPTTEKSVRAVWTRDLDIYPDADNLPQDNEPFRMSLTRADRVILVRQTSDPRKVTPQPVEARRLYLSALGAWLDLRGIWDTTPYASLHVASITSWDHRAAMGRDYYVKVVYPGYLFPFGHRAALVKVTKRKIKQETGQAPQAHLFQRKFLVIAEPEKTYGLDAEGRRFPFRRLCIGPLITPDLADPVELSTTEPGLAPDGQSVFWPSLPPGTPGAGHRRFLFDLDAQDRDGKPVHLQAPLLFVADGYKSESKVPGFYAANGASGPSPAPESGGVVLAAGQGIAVVPSGKPGDAVLEATWLRFTGEPENTGSRPRLVDARVVVPAAKHLAPEAKPARMVYAQPWLDGAAHGATKEQPFGTENTGEVFVELRADDAFDATADEPPAPRTFEGLADAGVGVSYAGGTGSSGGFIQPDLPGKGLSRSHGLVGDLVNVANSTFNAKDFLGNTALPRLFGLFNLVDLIAPGDLGLDEAPTFVVEHGDDPANGAVHARMSWQPPMQSWPTKNPVLELLPNALTLSVEVAGAGADGTASTDVWAELVNFHLHLMPAEPLMSVHFEKLVFSSQSGRKPDVDVVFGGMTFDGVLGFIETLRQVIPLDGFSDPPSLDVSTEGITAGFDLALPNIAVGMFSLENMSVGADCRIPFLGEAVTVGFHFCTREKPFRITVMMIGGGGFVGLRLSPQGMVMLEMALEAGASLSVDFGVASGSVSVMVGIYLRLEDDKGSLTGYFRIRGEVEVLAIASACLTLELSLTYDFDTGKMIGRASLVIEVEVLCFSASVEVVCERQLAGSQGDPTFAEILGGVAPDGSNPHWAEYCQAFAGA